MSSLIFWHSKTAPNASEAIIDKEPLIPLKTKTANGNWSVVFASRLTMVNLCTSEILRLLILGVNLQFNGEL